MKYRLLCLTDRSDLPETELFIRLRKAGVDIEVACNPTGRYFERLRRSGVPVHELIIKRRFSPRSIRTVRALLASRGFDILFCFNNKAASNALLAVRKKKPGPPVVTYRGTVGNISFLSPSSWTTHLNPRVRRIVCVSRAVSDHLLAMRFLGIRISPERVATIYKGHDPAWYQQRPADLRGLFGLPEDAFVVSFAGRNRPHKGIRYLIEAAGHLPPEAPIHFLLLGRLETDPAIKRQIAKLPNPERVHLAGFRSDAPAVFCASDAFVMPSTSREGLSRAVIEAMAYATPPVVTNVGGLPELVVHDESGFVVPPGDAGAIADAICRLYREPEVAERMGAAAKARIETAFHIDRTVRQIIRLFEDLAVESGQGR
jgi:glycosyltransferase involved in cell wall biosynthesis